MYFWSPPGYRPDLVENLLKKGDEKMAPQEKSTISDWKTKLAGDSPISLPPLDTRLLKDICKYFVSREHKDPSLDTLTWNKKKEMITPKYWENDREMILNFDPLAYWKENVDFVLQGLDYYKRALNFSGPEIRVPKRIEEASLASCRYSEIILGYSSYVFQTEDFIKDRYLKDILGKGKFAKPSWYKRFWNWIRGRSIPKMDFPQESNLTPKQIQLRIWDIIRNGNAREVTRGEFLEGVRKALQSAGKKMDESSPEQALEFYERLLFFVSNQNDPLEYSRYRKNRGEIYLRFSKENPKYLDLAISEFRDSAKIVNQTEIPQEVLPAVLIESFSLELGIAKAYFQEKKYENALQELDRIQSKLRNIDDRSTKGGEVAKKSLLQEYRFIRKTTLRNLNRFEEADEIPDDIP
jgi:tetratricopeptide (TPR) repeat protein